jgi:hypothetical protein
VCESLGLDDDGLRFGVERALRSTDAVVVPVRDVVENKTGQGALAVVDAVVSLGKVTAGYVGCVELRVTQEVLLRQGVSATGVTWYQLEQIAAASPETLGQRAQASLARLVEKLVADIQATRGASAGVGRGPALDCLKWSLRGVRPGEDWSAALLIVG